MILGIEVFLIYKRVAYLNESYYKVINLNQTTHNI